MTLTDTNKTLVKRFYQAVDSGDVAAVEELFALEWENIDPALPPMAGLEGARSLVQMFTAGFPDFSSKIELMAAESDRVAVRALHTGTHRGEFMGIPATGKRVSVHATGIYTCKDGKLVQNRVVFDAFGLLQQLGVVSF
ncbi:MAG: ester cyclase [Anaerolineae bacterium]|nr:ester cyclase [Anaerolineae bacterium]